jgi:3-hydroxyacyl-[acyl-carrier-protein] dehydratase
MREDMSPEKTQQLHAAAMVDMAGIMAILPHRYPFLLIDRVTEIKPKQRIVAWKNVTFNEPHFQGHFPGYAIMPGVLMIEALAQTGGVLLLPEVMGDGDKLMVLSGIEKARFRRPVTPGDVLRLEVDVLQWKPRAARMQGSAYVGDKLACEALLMCHLVPRAVSAAAGSAAPGSSATEPTAVRETVDAGGGE